MSQAYSYWNGAVNRTKLHPYPHKAYVPVKETSSVIAVESLSIIQNYPSYMYIFHIIRRFLSQEK